MMPGKELLTPGVSAKKTVREAITPHKLAVLLFIREFCLLKIKVWSEPTWKYDKAGFYSMKPWHRKDFCILVLKLIQSPDLELQELLQLLSSGEYSLVPKHEKEFKASLKKVYDQGIAGVMDLIQSLESLMVDPTHPVPVVNKSSVIGLFLRRMILFFDKLTFSQVTQVYRAYRIYYDAGFGELEGMNLPKLEKTEQEVNMTLCSEEIMEINESMEKKLDLAVPCCEISQAHSSRKQAELFISQQAALIQTNESEALPPTELQKRIRELLTTNPEIAEAHYLSYLNSLRVKEFCGAIHSLYHHFDKITLTTETKSSSQEDVNRGFRYAALNLAALHARFGHKKEAMAALKEAITMAQETNDNVCLQHALSWLYRLREDSKETLMERSIAKSSDLNLSYLTSLGIQSFSQYAAITGVKPSLVLDVLMRSDILNCQHSMLELMANSYAQKAGLWTLYGKMTMASLASQLLLHLNTADVTRNGLYYNGEGVCAAICNVARILSQQGDYAEAMAVIQHAKERFPSQSTAFCEQNIIFTRAMHHGKWQEAEMAIINLNAVNTMESRCRKAELLLYNGQTPEAAKLISKLLDECSKEKEMPAEYMVHVHVLQGELHCISGNCSAAIFSFTTALALCHHHHLEYTAAIVTVHMANVQLHIGLPSQALRLIDQSLVTIFAHGSLYDQARSLLLYAKCMVASSVGQQPEKRKSHILNAVNILGRVKNDFMKVEAYQRVKDILYLQARLYHELGYNTERNQCASEFRKIYQQYQMNDSSVLVTML